MRVNSDSDSSLLGDDGRDVPLVPAVALVVEVVGDESRAVAEQRPFGIAEVAAAAVVPQDQLFGFVDARALGVDQARPDAVRLLAVAVGEQDAAAGHADRGVRISPQPMALGLAPGLA